MGNRRRFRAIRFLQISALAAPLFIAACDGHGEGQSASQNEPQYSDQVTHEQQWQRDDAVRAYEQQHGGYSGAFACHTADGGCLHMVCSTKMSCDYMAEAEKRCAAPGMSNDPKVLDRLVIKDDQCASVEVPQSSTAAVVSGGTGLVTSSGNNVCTMQSNGQWSCR